MINMKIHIYAICKNEEKNIERWLECCKKADSITLLDNGSTDRTVDIARSKGIKIYEFKIEPFRFDVARNISLALTPDTGGLYLPLDLDMFLRENAIDILRKRCEGKNFAMVGIRQRWSSGKEGVWFAHGRYVTWKHPVYEQVHYDGKGHFINEVLIDHEQEHPIEKLEWYESLAVHNETNYGQRALKQIRHEIEKINIGG